MYRSFIVAVGILIAAGAFLVGGTRPSEAAAAVAVGGRGGDNLFWAFNHGSIGSARSTALRNCQREHGRSCRIVTSFVGQCFAMARPANRRGHGWAWRNSLGPARSVAIRECERRNQRQCFVENQFCDG